METFAMLIYILVLVIFGLIAFAVLQIRTAGIKVKDFMSFIQANQMLDSLYKMSKNCEKLTPQQQVVFLLEAEKVFKAYDKIPSLVWEDEYRKYSDVLNVYKDIRVNRWSSDSR